ncbi:M28 family peptidase [Pontibacter sp. KCTC 32443]|uniref:M28 family metallopeptidase n=1 Tax=Pontibacter TaxID=323449 RepID=UPI00164CFC22|nr:MULTISPECIES: M28 family peptidase [Pontibacter]MBC5775657.1 M28 family peptidase [Pontibacter sp. KCTC 32443]
MKLLLRLLLPVLCLCVLQLHAQDMPRVRQTIDTLTSPYFHGRGYIFDGDAKAANYIHDRYKAAGLKPISDTYFQEFSMPVNRVTQTPELAVNGHKLIPGTDFVANAQTAAGKGKATIVYLDTLVFTNDAAAQQFFSQSFRKKTLVYPQHYRKQVWELPEAYLQKVLEAKLHIILQPKALMTTVAARPATVPIVEVKKDVWPATAQKVKYKLVSEFTPAHKTQNVIAFIPGTAQPDSFIVFSAHYDHLGGQGKDVYFPGANDNASGTTMLLELAAHYSKPQNQPKYSMAFMAFAAEEAGLLGSVYYTDHPLFPLQNIRFLVNLDLLGTGDEGIMVVNGSIHPKEFSLLQTINSQENYLPQVKMRGRAANSDHYPFSERGVPAFFFYTLGGTAAYHNTQDHSRQLPLTKFKEVFRLITDFAKALQPR